MSADIATSRVELGGEPWQTARVYLAPEDPEGAYAGEQSHRLVRLIGTTERQRFARIFDFPGGVTRVVLAIELPETTGNMEVANLELEVVEELPRFRLAAALLVCGWTLLGCAVAARLHRSLGPTVRAWLMVTVAVCLVALWLPAMIREQLIATLAGSVGLHLADPDGFARALAFAVLALLVRIGRPRDSLLLHVSCWILAAAVTEVWQLLTADGYPRALNWLTTALGGALGLGLAEIALALKRLHRGPLPKPPAAPPTTADGIHPDQPGLEMETTDQPPDSAIEQYLFPVRLSDCLITVRTITMKEKYRHGIGRTESRVLWHRNAIHVFNT